MHTNRFCQNSVFAAQKSWSSMYMFVETLLGMEGDEDSTLFSSITYKYPLIVRTYLKWAYYISTHPLHWKNKVYMYITEFWLFHILEDIESGCQCLTVNLNVSRKFASWNCFKCVRYWKIGCIVVAIRNLATSYFKWQFMLSTIKIQTLALPVEDLLIMIFLGIWSPYQHDTM